MEIEIRTLGQEENEENDEARKYQKVGWTRSNKTRKGYTAFAVMKRNHLAETALR